jgi:chemotaxis signal transduction protein
MIASLPTVTPVMSAQPSTAKLLSTGLVDRFILTQVDRLTLVFPALWVAEIVRIERSQILDLPFYTPLLAGITHQNGKILPLISAHRLLHSAQTGLRETSTVVKLNSSAESLSRIGLVVDHAVGSRTRNDLPDSLFEGTPKTAESMVLIGPELLPPDLWQPQRWMV